MAGPDTPPPLTDSAYTDPFYDRLDSFFSWLGQRWMLVASILLLAVGLAVFLRYSLASHPDAASAAALQQARFQGIEAVEALIDDAQIGAEARARAALDVAGQRLEQDDWDAALGFAEKAVQLAEQTTLANLQAASSMSLARVYEEAGQPARARQLYQEVATRFRGQLAAYTLSADIAAALLGLQLAEQSDSEDEAEDLRWQALQVLHDYADGIAQGGAAPIIETASWRYFDLRRRFPALAQRLDLQLGLSGSPSEPSLEVLPEESDDEAVEGDENEASTDTDPAASQAPAVEASEEAAP